MTNIQLWMIKAAAATVFIGALWAANQHFIVNPAVNAENSRWQQKWDARDKSDAAAALKQEKENRDKEQALQASADEEQRKTDAARGDLARRLAASRAESERLQSGVQAAIDSLAAGTAAGAAPGRQTGNGAGVLLAELYRSINQRAVDLAGEADRARAAGLTCERLWDNARQSSKEKAR